MSIFVGKQESARHKIPFDNLPSVKEVYKEKWIVNPAWCVADYGAMLDYVYESADMQAVSNGESVVYAVSQVMQHMRDHEGWYILLHDLKTIANMLES